MKHYYLIKLHYFDICTQKWADKIQLKVCLPTHIKKTYNDYVNWFSNLQGVCSVSGECYEVTDLEKII